MCTQAYGRKFSWKYVSISGSRMNTGRTLKIGSNADGGVYPIDDALVTTEDVTNH
jgi:hypothetical protein